MRPFTNIWPGKKESDLSTPWNPESRVSKDENANNRSRHKNREKPVVKTPLCPISGQLVKAAHENGHVVWPVRAKERENFIDLLVAEELYEVTLVNEAEGDVLPRQVPEQFRQTTVTKLRTFGFDPDNPLIVTSGDMKGEKVKLILASTPFFSSLKVKPTEDEPIGQNWHVLVLNERDQVVGCIDWSIVKTGRHLYRVPLQGSQGNGMAGPVKAEDHAAMRGWIKKAVKNGRVAIRTVAMS